MANKKRNIIIVSIIVILTIVIIAVGYNLSKNGSKTKIGLKLDNDYIKAGETIEVAVEIENLNSNIYNLKGLLDYDESIFESITSEDIKDENDWTTTYNVENKVFFSGRSEETSDDGTIMTLDLKAKNDIDLKDTTIKITELEISGVDDSKELDDSLVKLKIKR